MFDRFNTAKAETQTRLCAARIRLQKNKHNIAVENMKRDVAQLLRDGKQDYARIRVEGVIRGNLLLQAYEILELYLELLAVRTQLVAKSKAMPGDMVEAISSIIYASQRVGELPELSSLRELFLQKYGKEYIQEAASDVTCTKWQVNPNLIRCLLVEPPTPEDKLACLSDIAQKNGVEWDISAAARDMLPPGCTVPAAPAGSGTSSHGPGTPTHGQHAWGPPHLAPQGQQGGPPAGFAMMNAEQAAAAAAAAAAHARAMAEYAAQLAMQHAANQGGIQQYAQPPLPMGQAPAEGLAPPPGGWLAHQPGPGSAMPGWGGNGGQAGPSHVHSGQMAPLPPGPSMEEVQRAYDAAVGPPTKGAVSAPPAVGDELPAPPSGSIHGAGAGLWPATLPSPPGSLPHPPSTVLPGTLNLPQPPNTLCQPKDDNDEDEALARRLEALKRS